MKKTIVINRVPVVYELQYKNVKRINLRIHRDGGVHVSANRFVGQEQIDCFLLQNGAFILETLERFGRMREAGDGMAMGRNRQYGNGDCLYLGGNPYCLQVVSGGRESVEEFGDILLVTQKDVSDAGRRKKMVEKFLSGRCKREIDTICKKVYPDFERLGVSWPEIRIRSMVSRWGSCQPTKGVLTFARQLTEVPKSCMEYVVVHEFAHFIYPDHSPRFHSFLFEIMPDWKERCKLLNSRAWVR